MIFGIAGIVKVITWIIAYKTIKPVAEKDGKGEQLKPNEMVDFLYFGLDIFIFVLVLYWSIAFCAFLCFEICW